MFDNMNNELANQHRKNILKDAENYRLIKAREAFDAKAKPVMSKGKNAKKSEALAGGLRSWLDMRIWKPVAELFHPRVSH